MPKTKTKTTERNANALLEKRVTALEEEMTALKHQMQEATKPRRPGPDDWKKSFGRFKDDPTFDEAVRLGREWRRRQPKV